MYNWGLFEIGIYVLLTLLVGVVLRLLILHQRQSAQLNKIGFVLREDTKKYLDTIAAVAKSTQEQFAEGNRELIKKAIDDVINVQGDLIAGNMAKADERIDQMMKQASMEAEQIVKQANTEKERIVDKLMSQSVYIMEKSIGAYIQDHFTLEQQQDVAFRKIVGDFLKDVTRE